MDRRWLGPLITLTILGGIVVILLMNLEPRRPPHPSAPAPLARPTVAAVVGGGTFREYPIGEPVEKEGMRIAAVWLPSVHVEGLQVVTGTDVIHLEADIHATEGNPNGFAKDEFVPYLKIHYEVLPAAGGEAMQEGPLYPMVAKDGLHYGVNIPMPKLGSYRLRYRIEPPSAGGLGRHDDPLTGVAPWWEPFTAEFAWEVEASAAP